MAPGAAAVTADAAEVEQGVRSGAGSRGKMGMTMIRPIYFGMLSG